MIYEHDKRLLGRLSKPELGSGLGLGMTGGGNVTPALDLNFLTGVMDSRISFTRGSTATRVNAAGVIETVSTGVPRFDYDPVSLAAKGLLIEEQRTNLLLRSAEFDNASWAKNVLNVNANAAVSPDGTSAADQLSPIANISASVYQDVTLSTSTAYRLSVYLKNIGAGRTTIGLYDATAGAFEGQLAIVWTAGVPSQSSVSGSATAAQFTDAGEGWYRISVSITSDASNTVHRAYIYPDSLAGTGAIYAWGAQLETGAFATSYIPTVASPATRSADTASMSGAAFSGWWNASEGTIILDIIPPVANRIALSINDGSNDNRFNFQPGAFSQVSIATATVTQSTLGAGDLVFGTRNVLAYAYRTNDTALSVNGGAVVDDTSITLPDVVRSEIGTGLGGAAPINGYIRRLRYYRCRFPGALLASLSL